MGSRTPPPRWRRGWLAFTRDGPCAIRQNLPVITHARHFLTLDCPLGLGVFSRNRGAVVGPGSARMSSLCAVSSVAAVSGCAQQRIAAGRRASRGALQLTAAAGASAAAGGEAAPEPSSLSRRQMLGAAAAASLAAAGAGSVGTGGSWVAPLPAEAAPLAPLGGIERVGGDKLTGLTAEQVKVREATFAAAVAAVHHSSAPATAAS